MPLTIDEVCSLNNKLGEGPLWDEALQQLFWVDSLKGQIFRLDYQSQQVSNWETGEMTGCLALVSDQQAIVALQSGLHWFNFTDGALTPVPHTSVTDARTRFNDGKTDRAGNFLTGTMGITIREPALGALYRLNKDLSLECLLTDVAVSNGPCFSPDGSLFYFTDGKRRIFAFDYDPHGPLRGQRVLIDTGALGFASDGATIDSEGNLWTALIQPGEIGCFSPQGKLLTRFSIPARLPSSVMFGGPALDELYITSISESGNRTSPEPEAGRLFVVRGTGVRGIAEPRFQPHR
ncbi:MAG: SMP-30/gluconolactonase/LRE family protein [Pseudomonadales bacterium]|nr:SMP-30/gluconolactonase/LRE family protein [Pseudomonadales bacterium]